MDAPLTAIKPGELDETIEKSAEKSAETSTELTVEQALAVWRGRHGARDGRRWPEPLLAAGELHGVMPRV